MFEVTPGNAFWWGFMAATTVGFLLDLATDAAIHWHRRRRDSREGERTMSDATPPRPTDAEIAAMRDRADATYKGTNANGNVFRAHDEGYALGVAIALDWVLGAGKDGPPFPPEDKA